MIIIGGVTGSGKSELAVRLAKEINGEIISADSMQIYRYMNIGTAKIKEEEKLGIPHYMLDIIDPTESFSVAEYAIKAEKYISEIESRGKEPIIVGGTGLYINALLYPFSYGKVEKNPETRKQLEAEWERVGIEQMYARLLSLDEEGAAKIHPNNKVRVIRALEILENGGCLSKQSEKKPKRDYTLFTIERDRGYLYNRINDRVDEMIEGGLEKEVEELIKNRGVTFSMQAMQAIGYKEFSDFYKGIYGKEELIELIKTHSRNYAKRQITWFKRYEDKINLTGTNIDENLKMILMYSKLE